MRFNVINLVREKVVFSVGSTYTQAVAEADAAEDATGQLHGVERGY